MDSVASADDTRGLPSAARRVRPEVHDETLRDGLQSPSVIDPAITTKREILHLLARVGVDSVNLGLPAAGPRAFDQVVALAQEIVEAKLPLRAGCAGRTVVSDLEPIAAASQRAGLPIDVMTFIGSSPIRRFVEGWSVETIRKRSSDAFRFARREGLTVTYVTEDTTRTPPEVLEELFTAALDEGVARLCLCDTVGHATQDGTTNLVRWTRALIDRAGSSAHIDWHGHEDRGLSLPNALAAIDAGADRVHGCVLGIGERVGNTPLEMLLLNLEADDALAGRDLSHLPELCRLVSHTTGYQPRPGHPLFSPIRPERLVGPHRWSWDRNRWEDAPSEDDG
ncbi:MAG: 2-isopropylmalate synthase [Sandaracinaceae bacterium]|nr:2-isopropylmalate synthase [Sandaracinaceae bacterium]